MIIRFCSSLFFILHHGPSVRGGQRPNISRMRVNRNPPSTLVCSSGVFLEVCTFRDTICILCAVFFSFGIITTAWRDERVSSEVKGEVWKTALRIAEVLTGSDNQRAELGVGVGVGGQGREQQSLTCYQDGRGCRSEDVRATLL